MKGFFFVFEGVDGAGKSTVVSEVKRVLVESGVKKSRVFVTAEPSDSSLGKEIRHLLSLEKNPFLDGLAFVSLYLLDRKHHLKKDVLPALFEGKIVLCDRYKYSTFVYQSIQGVPAKKIVALHEKMLVPDLVFVLDLPVKLALKRLRGSGKASEVFEQKTFLLKARKKFLRLKFFFPKEKIVIVKASRPLPEIVSFIVQKIKKLV